MKSEVKINKYFQKVLILNLKILPDNTEFSKMYVCKSFELVFIVLIK